MKRKSQTLNKPLRSAQTPATAAMLYEVEERLVHRMDAGFAATKAQFHGLKSEVHGFKSEVHGLKSEVHGFKSEFQSLKSEVHGLKSELHRVALLVEEQNARNKYVMDGYAQLYEFVKERQA